MLAHNNKSKDTSFLLSTQVQKNLASKGYSHLFNWNDYYFYKNRIQKSFNKALDIALLFIQENPQTQSDFSDYEF